MKDEAEIENGFRGIKELILNYDDSNGCLFELSQVLDKYFEGAL